MRRAGMLGLFVVALCGSTQAVQAQSPAAPSYIAVTRSIDKLTEALNGPIPGGQEALPGWNDFLGSVKAELDAHGKAKSFADRLTALYKLAGYSNSLATVGWQPAADVHTALDAWVQPRLQIATAAESLRQVIASAPTSAQDATYRQGWTNFVDTYLAGAFQAYDTAATVQARQKALIQISEALSALERAANWQPSMQVAWAARSLVSQPNVDITADANTLSRYFARELVQSGPVTRKGYVSQVTAGPYLGFGLFASNEGIGFYNMQNLSNYTPIWDFQNQMQKDPRGQRVTKLYNFSAASTDGSDLTVMSLITPSGLRLWSTATHNTDAIIGSSKTAGHGLQRGILSLIGMNQPKITKKVYDGGIGEIRSNLDRESAEERAERMAAAEAEENAKLANVLIGNRTAVFQDFLITGLDLRSQPTYAMAGGTVGWKGGALHLGADQPQPPQFNVLAPGVVADVHLISLLANLSTGAWESPKVKEVNNVLVQTKVVNPAVPGDKPVAILTNAKFADYLKAVNDAQAAKNPKVQAVWLKKPSDPPIFGVDARGFLVVMVPDLQMDVAVPAQFAGATGNAKILRIKAPMAEIVLDIKIKPNAPGGPLQVDGGIKEFHGGPGAKVFTINDDEAKAVEMNRLTSILVLQGFGRALAAQPINAPLTGLKLPGYEIQSVSDLDPSGWMRLILTASNEPVQAPAPAPGPAGLQKDDTMAAAPTPVTPVAAAAVVEAPAPAGVAGGGQ